MRRAVRGEEMRRPGASVVVVALAGRRDESDRDPALRTISPGLRVKEVEDEDEDEEAEVVAETSVL
jgi:hypothetical protein